MLSSITIGGNVLDWHIFGNVLTNLDWIYIIPSALLLIALDINRTRYKSNPYVCIMLVFIWFITLATLANIYPV
ncbi:hypothetical protein [Moraxella lacunata]|uniref:hypothetical protein n=1 Tax=Moraxella lacunata TaxID=477 RepID=UPI003EE16EA1